jgi:hypothetical protein
MLVRHKQLTKQNCTDLLCVGFMTQVFRRMMHANRGGHLLREAIQKHLVLVRGPFTSIFHSVNHYWGKRKNYRGNATVRGRTLFTPRA